MQKRSRLSDQEIQSALAKLPEWSFTDGKLHKAFRFRDFPSAFGFMATAAPTIERNDHHPEWTNVYNRVTVHLSTHDAGGVTSLDVELAELLESIANRLA